MRHRVAAKHFNRDANQRKLLIKGLVTELIEHGAMTTTKPRALEIRRIADKLIHEAQTDNVAVRRNLHRFFGKRDIVNTLVDRIAPLFKDRTSGFTRIVSVGIRRGDNSEQVTLSLITQPEVKDTLKSGKTHEAKPKAAKKVVKAEAKVAATKEAAPKKAAKPAAKTTRVKKTK